jgi:hypothetical protein
MVPANKGFPQVKEFPRKLYAISTHAPRRPYSTVARDPPMSLACPGNKNPYIFYKGRKYLPILGARRETRSKLHTGEPRIITECPTNLTVTALSAPCTFLYERKQTAITLRILSVTIQNSVARQRSGRVTWVPTFRKNPLQTHS